MTHGLEIALATWAQNAVALRLGSALLHFVWQGAFLAAIAAVLLAALHKARPQARYLALAAIFLGMAVCPAATFYLLSEETADNPPHRAAGASLGASPPTAADTPVPAGNDMARPAVVHRAVPAEFSGRTAAAPAWMIVADWLNHHRHWVVITWLAGVCLLSFRLILGLIGAERARRLATSPVTASVADAVARLSSQLGIRRAVCVLQSSLSEVPALVGWLRPVILLPASVLSGLTPTELEAILAHELAHVRRHDYLVNLFQTVIETVLFYHPAIWWLSRRIRHERELCCDDMAISICKDRVAYARALATLESLRVPPAWAIAARGGKLLSRIHRIVGQPEAQRGVNLALVFIAVLLTVVVFLAAPRHSEILAQEAASGKQAADQPVVQKTQKAPVDVWREFEFKVVNSKREPVAETTIKPWQIAYSSGSFLPEESLTAPLKTDASGTFRFVIPKETRAAKILEEFKIRSVAFRIDDPRYPLWSDYVPVEGNREIVLAESGTIEVRVQREGESGPPRNLYSSPGTSDWSENAGVVTLRRVDLTTSRAMRWLRIVQVPEQGPAWFSDLIDLKQQGNAPQVSLKAPVRVAGRLADNVPRPVTGGRIIARIVAPYEKDFPASRWQWSAAAPIAADGTFLLESLPANENLQLIARCDGWNSVSPTLQEVQAYGNANSFATEPRDDTRMVASSRVYPRLYRLTAPGIEPVIPMKAALQCEVTVVDTNDKPIPGARVAFSPNQYTFEAGSQLLGAESDSLTILRTAKAKAAPAPVRPTSQANPFAKQTDARGIALITDLPDSGPAAADPTVPRQLRFHVTHNDFQLPIDAQVNELSTARYQSIGVLPGQTGKVTVRMQRK